MIIRYPHPSSVTHRHNSLETAKVLLFLKTHLIKTAFGFDFNTYSKILSYLVHTIIIIFYPNVLYASSNVLIIPLPLLSLIFFGLSHLSTYRSLLHSKHSNFLISSINSASSSSSRWKNLNRIFFKQSPPPPFSFQDFQDYFHNKILSIRTNRSSSHTPPVSSPASVSLSHFSPITFTDLISIIKSAVSSSSCSLDPIPPKILNDLSSFFYPIILNLINLSLATSKFSIFFKSSIVTPILKKPSLDPSIISNYRPIFNLSFLSKILEKAIYLQLPKFLLSNNLPPTQSGFRPSHSTENCLLKISNDALRLW